MEREGEIATVADWWQECTANDMNQPAGEPDRARPAARQTGSLLPPVRLPESASVYVCVISLIPVAGDKKVS